MKNSPDLDPYLLRRLEEASGYYASSFSNRYMNQKRCYSLLKAVSEELGRLGARSKTGTIKILDIGCGDGALIYKLKALIDPKRDLYFMGLDLSALDIDFANRRKAYYGHKNCDFLVGDIATAVIPPQTFDMIICSEVVEHLKEPEQLLRQVRIFLRDGGLFIVTTPQEGGGLLGRALHFANRGLLQRITKEIKKRLEATIVHFLEKKLSRFSSADGHTGAGLDHVSVKRVSAWRKMFASFGFRVTSLKGTGGLLFGNPFLDQHRVLFALVVILDVIFDALPFSHWWGESTLYEMRKDSFPT
jgi:2-polyprenyl-3-methyl-5-hydroxy-6-metoxy-1,4-benzoquinol methylase